MMNLRDDAQSEAKTFKRDKANFEAHQHLRIVARGVSRDGVTGLQRFILRVGRNLLMRRGWCLSRPALGSGQDEGLRNLI